MTKLSDTQRAILSAAAQHETGLARAPKTLPAAARNAVFRSMIKSNLPIEINALQEHVGLGGRQEEDGTRIVARITGEGLLPGHKPLDLTPRRAEGGAMITPEQNQASILLIEDDPILSGELVNTFNDHGIHARAVDNWTAALSLLEDYQPDLILLDQRLGSVDTLMMVPALRTLSAAPILFLTGNRNEADRVIGLELGADDFLLKPIAGRELVARVRAHLRRATRRPAHVSGEWKILEAERRLLRPDGTPVPLTATEFTLLALMAAQPGVPFDRDTLTQRVLRRHYRAEDRSLDNLVHQIRRKLGRRGAGEVITAIRSQGYAFSGFPEA